MKFILKETSEKQVKLIKSLQPLEKQLVRCVFAPKINEPINLLRSLPVSKVNPEPISKIVTYLEDRFQRSQSLEDFKICCAILKMMENTKPSLQPTILR